MAERTMKKGDLLPDFEVTLEDANGPVDLDLATSLRFIGILKDDLGGAPTFDGTFIPDGDQVANKGLGKYLFTAGDTDVLGTYFCEVEALYGTKPLTFPNDGYYFLTIIDDVDENV